MMHVAWHVVAAVCGLAVIFVFMQSVLRVAVVNRRGGDALARILGFAVYSVLARIAARRRSFGDVQDVLAWSLPLYIVVVTVVWFLLAQIGFGLVIWGVQAEDNPLTAFIASGSALSTLGFETPPTLIGRLLAIPEGALGLGIVVFFFTFLPGYQATIQAREVKVAWLYARTGRDPTMTRLLTWLLAAGQTERLAALWEDWEEWFRTLSEAHGLGPVTAFVPSVPRGQSWLVAAGVVLDSTAFCMAMLQTHDPAAAGLCHETGCITLRLLAEQLGWQPAPLAEPTASDRAAFDAACVLLAQHGVALLHDRDEGWRRFQAQRADHADALAYLAARLLVPLAAET